MKKLFSILVIAVLAVSMLAMTSCGKSEFSGSIDDEKNMTINAVKAGSGDYFVTGTLVVADGEQIHIDPKLDAGSVILEFISAEGMDNIEEIPELNGDEATYKTEVSGTDSQAVSFGAGSFMVKATVNEKATGSIAITIKE